MSDSLVRKDFVVIDDDPVFCNLMASLAYRAGYSMDYYDSLQEMGSIGQLAKYEVAIVDFDLGPVNGVEIAEYLPIFFGDMPLILISNKQRQANPNNPWPRSIKHFINKSSGAKHILQCACEMQNARHLSFSSSQSLEIPNDSMSQVSSGGPFSPSQLEFLL